MNAIAFWRNLKTEGLYSKNSSLVVKLLLTVSFVSSFAFGLQAFSQNRVTDITFLHTNDVYEISQKNGLGGMATLKTLLDEEKARNPNSLITFGGDLLSPSVLSNFLKGSQMIDMLNRIGVDFATAGNHEFDFGPEIAAQRFSESEFTWLNINMVTKDKKVPFKMKQAIIKNFNGVNVGIFGIVATNTIEVSSPGDDLHFYDAFSSAEQMTKSLKDNGADVIVAIAHLPFSQDRELALNVPDIDLILSGDDHVPAFYMVGNTLIAEGPEDAKQLVVVDMHVVRDTENNDVDVTFDWHTRRNDSFVKPDPKIASVVASYEERLDESLGEKIYTTPINLVTEREIVRSRESNFGNLLADAMRIATNADAALTNGGGIRGNRVYNAGTAITRKDILTELPFGNVTVLLEIKGSDIVTALENGVSQIEDRAGRFPQVSNIVFEYSEQAKAGSRITRVEIDGNELDPNKTYRLATNDYMASGGDGYESLKKGKQIIDASAATFIATDVINGLLNGTIKVSNTEGRINKR